MILRKPRRIRSQNAPLGVWDDIVAKNKDTFKTENEVIDEVIDEVVEKVNDRIIDIEDSRNQDVRIGLENRNQQLFESALRNINSGLIGIFGMRSDEIMNSLLNRSYFGRVIECPSYNSPIDDIYNIIASGCVHFLNIEVERARFNFRSSGSLEYNVRAIFRELEDIYKGANSEYDEYETGLTLLSRMSKDRGKDLKQIIDWIPSALELGTDFKLFFILHFDMGVINYKVLDQISKINSSNTIFIINSLEPVALAEGMIGASINNSYLAHSFMNKFFDNRIFEFN